MHFTLIVFAVLLAPTIIRSGSISDKDKKDLELPRILDEEKKTEKRSGLTLINTITFTSEPHIIVQMRD